MWKVFLALVTNRLLLFLVALFAINYHTSTPQAGKTFRPIQPTEILVGNFIQRVSENPEANALNQFRARPLLDVFRESLNPFLWINRIFVAVVPISSTLSVIFWSNLFLILFLWELFAVVERLAISEVGVGAATLMAFWVTSYELSLGASLSFSCYTMLLSIRCALDNQWLFGGIGTGFLIFAEPVAAALLPLFLFVFLYHQRHSPMRDLFKELFFFTIPVAIACFFHWGTIAHLQSMAESSALFNVIKMFETRGQFSWVLSQSFLGQTVSIAFFLLGAICSLVVNTSILYRVIPIYVLILVLSSSSYGVIASRLSLAAVCLGGIAAVSSPIVTWVLQLLLLALGSAEVFAIFS